MAGGACDFQRSYMYWDVAPRTDPRPYARHEAPLGNKVRILLEALLDVVDDATGTAERYILIAPCRAEWVYAEDHLFQVPSREYRNIYSLTHSRGVGSSMIIDEQALQDHQTKGVTNADRYRYVRIETTQYPRTRTLNTVEELIAATEEGLPLNGRTELHDDARGLTYILEYPIKTLNYQPEGRAFQVDTGPLLVPDTTSVEEHPIDRLARAHIIYNHKHLDRAEFILFRPTPVKDDDRELCQVMHYSEVQAHPAKNTLLAGIPA